MGSLCEISLGPQKLAPWQLRPPELSLFDSISEGSSAQWEEGATSRSLWALERVILGGERLQVSEVVFLHLRSSFFLSFGGMGKRGTKLRDP